MPLNSTIGSSIIEFEQLHSTNDYAMQLANEGNAEHGTTIVAQFQTNGKGQQGKEWISAKEKNLLLSVILDTSQRNIQSQFALNAACCTALANLLMEDYELAATTIKWPNDLYVGRKKIAGILIENVIRGTQWQYAIVGIGLNVNQLTFPEETPATSLHLEKKKECTLVSVRNKLISRLNLAYRDFMQHQDELITEYNQLLHGFEQEIGFKQNGKTCYGKLLGADKDGMLTIDKQRYRHGEIQLFI